MPFNKDMSVEEILEEIQKHISVTFEKEIGECFLQYKLQQQLLNEQKIQHKEVLNQQNKYNDKQLLWSRWLTLGTWALVIANILLIKFYN